MITVNFNKEIEAVYEDGAFEKIKITTDKSNDSYEIQFKNADICVDIKASLNYKDIEVLRRALSIVLDEKDIGYSFDESGENTYLKKEQKT